ncbi:MAG: hypothetical protein KAQ98_12320 [Bacteriovoracaceae bacterium]|nr:hypothetical protein [Bacteriovoracaceae bacterium]
MRGKVLRVFWRSFLIIMVLAVIISPVVVNHFQGETSVLDDHFWGERGLLDEIRTLNDYKSDMNNLLKERGKFEKYELGELVLSELAWSKRVLYAANKGKKLGIDSTAIKKQIGILDKIVATTENIYLRNKRIKNFNSNIDKMYTFLVKNEHKNLMTHTLQFRNEWEKVRGLFFKERIATLRNWKIILQKMENTALASSLSSGNKEEILEKLFHMRERSNEMNMLVEYSNRYISMKNKLGYYFLNLVMQADILQHNRILKSDYSRKFWNYLALCWGTIGIFFLVSGLLRSSGKKRAAVVQITPVISSDDETQIRNQVNNIITESLMDLANTTGNRSKTTLRHVENHYDN